MTLFKVLIWVTLVTSESSCEQSHGEWSVLQGNGIIADHQHWYSGLGNELIGCGRIVIGADNSGEKLFRDWQ